MPGFDPDKLIVVVGMPRGGTTSMYHIFDQHPGCFVLDHETVLDSPAPGLFARFDPRLSIGHVVFRVTPGQPGIDVRD